MSLKLPTEWLRSLSEEELEHTLATFTSMGKMAERYGVSESFLRTLFPRLKTLEFNFTEDQFIDALTRYKSIRLMARCLGNSESHLRREAERLDIDIAPLLDYSIGHNSNAKGRRAELAFALLRGDLIEEDLNLTKGSQAEADFIDKELKRVNVKSSAQWHYKAQTRKADPDFWKISTRGRNTCEHIAAMCYDRSMNQLVGYAIIPVTQIPLSVSTLTLKRGDLTIGV